MHKLSLFYALLYAFFFLIFKYYFEISLQVVQWKSYWSIDVTIAYIVTESDIHKCYLVWLYVYKS